MLAKRLPALVLIAFATFGTATCDLVPPAFKSDLLIVAAFCKWVHTIFSPVDLADCVGRLKDPPPNRDGPLPPGRPQAPAPRPRQRESLLSNGSDWTKR